MTRAVVVLALLLAGCAGVRNAYMNLKNDDLTGKQAPALTSTSWVGAAPTAKWRVLAFFKPR